MKTFQYRLSSGESLQNFINSRNIEDSNKVLIQIFYSILDTTVFNEIHQELNQRFLNASIIGTSTAGIVTEGNLVDHDMVISFSIFEATTTLSKGYKNCSVDEIMNDLNQNILKSNTKLLIIFTDVFNFNANSLLQMIQQQFPNIIIAGGNAGDDYRFKSSKVFANSMLECDMVCASLNSDVLNVQTDFLFNWETVGESMKVTHSIGKKVYSIDNKKPIDVYREYLGDDVADNLTHYGSEFPLIYEDKNVHIARALVSFDEQDGSITFTGEIPKNKEVKFGFVNTESIKKQNKKELLKKYKNKQETVFIYSCAARRKMIGSYLKKEIKLLSMIGKCSTGFITYGEFFHDSAMCINTLMNITTTFVSLNEHMSNEPIEFEKNSILYGKKDIKLNALASLVKKTSHKLDENNFYLNQFKKIVSESSIYSTTDEKGIITDANKNFEKISGYSREELIGKNHNIIRHPDATKESFQQLWSTIQNGKSWHGLLKNRTKSGTTYHVLSDVSPIYYKNGDFREYLGIRHNVTELEEYKILLKHELDTKSKTLEDNLNYTRQYEESVNDTVAIIKVNPKQKITYVNTKFLELSEYFPSEIIKLPWIQILDEHHKKNGDYEKIIHLLEEGKIVNCTMNNVGKYGKCFTTTSKFYPIKNLKGEIIEYIFVLNDITDIINLNNEIIDAQKEVVFTLGAIGESRSNETGLHVKRVAEYSYLLAKLYGLTEQEAQLLKQASPMHDIGKVGIPDNILNKQGKLTQEEFEIMKTHVELGYEMLKHSQRDILKASAIVARDHHEKWDGTGYPRGLKEEEIHIYGRITAVADVFDALGHDRIYKKAWPLSDIYEYLNNEKGKQFDPVLIDLFFEHVDQFLEIKELLA